MSRETRKPLVSDTAMVLAAGIGKRMRPLTVTRPKPLVRVAGKPLIDHALDKLAEAGVTRAVVNVHYLADQLEAHVRLRAMPKVQVSDERDALLETGGGLVRAMPLIDRDTFFCLNSDNIWLDGPRNAFAALGDFWDESRMDALLLLVSHAQAFNYTGLGDFHIDQMGLISRRKPGRVAPISSPASRSCRSGCCAMRPKAAFPPGGCGTARLPRDGSMACRTPGCGMKWARRK
jgi:MurNAc alpha-1-phosphate uridylyltransferase